MRKWNGLVNVIVTATQDIDLERRAGGHDQPYRGDSWSSTLYAQPDLNRCANAGYRFYRTTRLESSWSTCMEMFRKIAGSR